MKYFNTFALLLFLLFAFSSEAIIAWKETLKH